MIWLNDSWLLSARPPETTREADASSGRDEVVSSSERKAVETAGRAGGCVVSSERGSHGSRRRLTLGLLGLDLLDLHAPLLAQLGLVKRGRADRDDPHAPGLGLDLYLENRIPRIDRPLEHLAGGIDRENVGHDRRAERPRQPGKEVLRDGRVRCEEVRRVGV